MKWTSYFTIWNDSNRKPITMYMSYHSYLRISIPKLEWWSGPGVNLLLLSHM